ncbi:MAG: hypothetical protein M3527_05415, partial [Actinomycetota bacterium]|nr:hypothetical protein [Actinomycetota bacterium]
MTVTDLAVPDGVSPAARARGVLLGGRPARRLGIRARITLSFGLGALLLSTILAATTYTLTRSNLVDARERNVVRQTYLNARQVLQTLPREPETMRDLLASLQTPTGSNPIVFQDGTAFPLQPIQFGEDALLPELRRVVLTDGLPALMRYDLDGVPQLAVGIPLAVPDVDAAYFEIVDLSETEATLRALGLSLLGA